MEHSQNSGYLHGPPSTVHSRSRKSEHQETQPVTYQSPGSATHPFNVLQPGLTPYDAFVYSSSQSYFNPLVDQQANAGLYGPADGIGDVYNSHGYPQTIPEELCYSSNTHQPLITATGVHQSQTSWNPIFAPQKKAAFINQLAADNFPDSSADRVVNPPQNRASTNPTRSYGRRNRPLLPSPNKTYNNTSCDTSPAEPPQQQQKYTFINENPSQVAPANSSMTLRGDNDQQIQKRELRAALKEAGGPCNWCIQRRKGCDANEICSYCKNNSMPCLRTCKQVWLYSPTVGLDNKGHLTKKEQQRHLNTAKYETFAAAYTLIQNLSSVPESPITTGQVVFKCRWLYPNPSSLIPLDLPLQHAPLPFRPLPEEVRESLLTTVLDIIPGSIPYDPKKCPAILQASIHMLALTSFIISLSRGALFARPGDLLDCKVAFVRLFTCLVQLLAQLSEEFSMELINLFHRKASAAELYDAFLATGMYYRVLSGLFHFQPGPDSIIEVIFSGIRKQVEPVITLIDPLLRQDKFAGSYFERRDITPFPSSAEGFWKIFDQCVPPLPILKDLQIAPIPNDQTQNSLSTTLLRNFYPFSQSSPVNIAQLLSHSIERAFDHALGENTSIPGPDPVSFPAPTHGSKDSSNTAGNGPLEGTTVVGAATAPTRNQLTDSNSHAIFSESTLPDSDSPTVQDARSNSSTPVRTATEKDDFPILPEHWHEYVNWDNP